MAQKKNLILIAIPWMFMASSRYSCLQAYIRRQGPPTAPFASCLCFGVPSEIRILLSKTLDSRTFNLPIRCWLVCPSTGRREDPGIHGIRMLLHTRACIRDEHLLFIQHLPRVIANVCKHSPCLSLGQTSTEAPHKDGHVDGHLKPKSWNKPTEQTAGTDSCCCC